MKIDVCIQSYNFNRRLCWMLSSILQQKERKPGKGLPDIRVCVSYESSTDTGSVCDFFRNAGLNVYGRAYEGFELFKKRGNVRNMDLDTDAEWILWADSDMVYPPEFFGTLGHLLRTSFIDNPHCLYSARQSTILEPTRALIDLYEYPCIVHGAFEQASILESVLKANIGAGYCQIANVKNIKMNHGGKYVEVATDWDWDEEGQKAKSDQHFRHRLGKERIHLPVQIHLQHERTNPHERSC